MKLTSSLKAWRAKLGGAAGLGEHHRPLDVGGGGADEDQPRDHERERGQAEREGGDDAERVVDRRADVAVGGAEQGADAVDALQGLIAGNAVRHAVRDYTTAALRTRAARSAPSLPRTRPR